MLDFDLSNELNYESIAIFADIIEDGKKESSDVAQKVDTISASVRAIDATSRDTAQLVDNIDERLAEILERVLTLIAMQKDVLGQIKPSTTGKSATNRVPDRDRQRQRQCRRSTSAT